MTRQDKITGWMEKMPVGTKIELLPNNDDASRVYAPGIPSFSKSGALFTSDQDMYHYITGYQHAMQYFANNIDTSVPVVWSNDSLTATKSEEVCNEKSDA